jgi:hypothetical protein
MANNEARHERKRREDNAFRTDNAHFARVIAVSVESAKVSIMAMTKLIRKLTGVRERGRDYDVKDAPSLTRLTCHRVWSYCSYG